MDRRTAFQLYWGKPHTYEVVGEMFVCNHDVEHSTDNLQPAISHVCIKHVAEKATECLQHLVLIL